MRLWHGSSAVLAVALAVAWLLGALSSAGEEKSRAADPKAPAGGTAQAGKKGDAKKDSRLIVYVPPSRGAVGARTGGGTRSAANAPRISVLAPDHVGLTTRERPTLAWFIDGDTSAPIELTLIADGAVEPAVVAKFSGPNGAGIHLVDVGEHGGRLEEGVTYDWYVALVLDPKSRDSDVVAGAAIERVSTGADLSKDLTAAGEPSYRVLARHGIWYDAIADLSKAIAASPASSPSGRDLRAERAALLEQVGVGAAAVYERGSNTN